MRHCEECTSENYRNALQSDKVCMYSCHAGLVKWSMPIRCNAFSGVVISEGVITKQQVKDAETWVHYLSEHYNVRKDVLQDNYQVIKEMTEEEVNISIKLLKDLIDYQGDAGRTSGPGITETAGGPMMTPFGFLCIRFSFLSQRCYTL
ncbi:MAG: PocR ligand-binding domain-containing protein [Merdibacter sp.]